MDKYEEKAISDIEEYGCHILNVLEEENSPGFSYSIGIEKSTTQPELIIVGLRADLAQWMINEYNNRIKNGEIFEARKMYDGFLDDFEITFREVEKKHYKKYFGWANWLYRNDSYKVLQLIYPSTSGVWIWDEEAEEDFKWFQPKLYAH